MRTDYRTLREIIAGFSEIHPAQVSNQEPAQARPRRDLACLDPEFLEAPALEAAASRHPHHYQVGETFARRYSSVSYSPEPLDAEVLLSIVYQALVDEARTWAGQGAGELEVFVLFLRPKGVPPGIYRVRGAGVDLVGPLPDPAQIEAMSVQKEFAQAGAIISAAANLQAAAAWGGAHGYRHAMSRAASLIYSVHLRATAHDLVGTVFAGFSSSQVRHLLDSDGVARQQMFAVTVAHPAAQEQS